MLFIHAILHFLHYNNICIEPGAGGVAMKSMHKMFYFVIDMWDTLPMDNLRQHKMINAGTRLSIRSHMLKGSRLFRAACLLLLLLLYCEWLHYFVVLLQCTWPLLTHSPVGGWVFSQVDLKVMFISDIHLLGTREGHWFDKVRR